MQWWGKVAWLFVPLSLILSACTEKQNTPLDNPKLEEKTPTTSIQQTEFVRPAQTLFEAPSWKSAPPFPEDGKLIITAPLDEAMFPPEIIAPTFKWQDSSEPNRRWAIQFQLDETNRVSVAVAEPWWRPEPALWNQMKVCSARQPLCIRVTAYHIETADTPLSSATVRLQTSTDEVGADIFFREVNLPFLKAAIDPTQIRWRAGSIADEAMPKIILNNLPVCGNCHSFSRDSRLLAMDVDYANTKASYIVTPVGPEMSLSANNTISWNQYNTDDGVITFGLLSQISPDGHYTITTAKDSSVFVDTPGLEFSQLFFPIKGILVYYDRNLKTFSSLPGADDPKYVQSNPIWSPDGTELLFARTEAYDLLFTKRQGRVLLTRDECREFTADKKSFKYDIYRIPFNAGKGGKAEPLPGASLNGKSNFFPKYSPDGKWIIFCKAENYMLLQPDSHLYIIPASGGEPRLLRANLGKMNSWHSWSPNSRWLVFSSKENGPYTQLWLTHIDEQGISTPPVLLEHFTAPDRAANIPEFYSTTAGKIEQINPEFLDDESLVRSGTVFYFNQEWDKAMTDFGKATQINPRCFQALQRMGYIEFFVRNNQQKGIQYTLEALKLDPSYAFTQYDYGMECLILGQFKTARIHLAKSIELMPDGFDDTYDPILMRVGLADACLYDQDLTAAKATIQSALALNPNHPSANYKMATYLTLSNEEAEAVSYMNKALTIAPQVDVTPELHQYLGLWYAKQGQIEDAEYQLQRAFILAKEQNNLPLVSEIEQSLESLRNP